MTKKELKQITDHPFHFQAAQNGDAETLADIYYRNLELAYPSQKDFVENKVDIDRLRGFFKNLIESDDQDITILRGDRGTPYGFFTIGKPIEKQMRHAGLDYKNRMFLHHLFVNPDFHGRYFGNMLLKGISLAMSDTTQDRYSSKLNEQRDDRPALTTVVSQSNKRAIELFLQIGARRAQNISIHTFAGIDDLSCLMEWRRVTDIENGIARLHATRQSAIEGALASIAPPDSTP